MGVNVTLTDSAHIWCFRQLRHLAVIKVAHIYVISTAKASKSDIGTIVAFTPNSAFTEQ